MRILAFSDIHCDSEWADFVASKCGDCELLVLAGDLVNLFSRVPYHLQARSLTKWVLELRAPAIVLVSGNHDWWLAHGVSVDAAAEGRWIRNFRGGKGRVVGVDGDTVVIGGLKVHCHGWLQKLDLKQQIDVLVTHAPPAGTATAVAKSGQDFGNPEILDMQHMPRLIFCGHVHSPLAYWHRWPARDSLVLNPGYDENSPAPLHWTIDTEQGVAAHSLGEVVRFRKL